MGSFLHSETLEAKRKTIVLDALAPISSICSTNCFLHLRVVDRKLHKLAR